MPERRLSRLVLAALLCGSLQARAHGAADAVDQLRAPGGACSARTGPLLWNPALNTAAANIARGQGLSAALESAGYRASRVQQITIVGAAGGVQLQNFLASRFCTQLAMTELTEAGLYQADNSVWIVLAAPFALRVALTQGQIEARTLRLVNQARAQSRKCGETAYPATKPLKWNAALARAAQSHSVDMANNNYFSHMGRDGSTPDQRVEQAGYRYRFTGENIASGQRAVEEVVRGWIDSPSHCANLMNGRFTEMGVAFEFNVESTKGGYWTQVFGRPW